jgi:acylphosphatase
MGLGGPQASPRHISKSTTTSEPKKRKFDFSILKPLIQQVEEENRRELELWMQSNKAIHIIVHGLVQGVNYRAYTREEARKLGLVGTVKNLPDGTVEIFAEGPEDKLKQLEQWCYRGSPMSKVEKVVSEWISPTGKYQFFRIVRD